MAANFYLSTHANFHLHSHGALLEARQSDLHFATEQEVAWIEIWSASIIQKLAKRLGLRQQVIATAIVYFRRFYLRNSYAMTDPALVAAACCYVAAKAEETPVHVKSVVVEAKAVFSDMGLTNSVVPSFDNLKLAEMEFYLIEELDFHLIIFHPYRSLVQLCGRDGGGATTGPAGGREDETERMRRERMLDMDDAALQMAWFVINDTFRSSLCLMHPPHLIAIASIYLALSLHPPESIPTSASTPSSASSVATEPISSATTRITARTRRQSGTTIDLPTPSTSSSLVGNTRLPAPPATAKPTPVGGHTDAITFLSTLSVPLDVVLEIVQEIIALYALWHSLEALAAGGNGDQSPATKTSGAIPTESPSLGGGKGKGSTTGADELVMNILLRMRAAWNKGVSKEQNAASGGGVGGNTANAGGGKKARVK